jgi:prephenate dehydrogenase
MPQQLPVIRQPPPPGTPPLFERIAIVGCGLIGGSIALAARERWPKSLIIGVDRKDVLEAAMRMHAVDVGGDDLVMAAEADLIVLAAPVQQNVAVFDQLADCVPGSALVTDVGSTKVTTTDASKRLPDRLRFVGGHPLAGAAVGGIGAARSDLFVQRPWLLTVEPSSDERDIAQLEQFVTALGAVPKRLDAQTHDRLLAYLSHLPQLAASALMHVVGQHVGAEGLALAGGGLRDTTRLAASPPDIWRDVVATNAAHVGAAIDDLIAVLEMLRADLGRADAIEQIFSSAAEWKRQMEHGR